ncbi:MAG: response regulator [Spirochaetes bacterium]|nr:response regulator [Spirochaetota bacterium]
MKTKYHILFVDDEKNILSSLKRIFFQKKDYQIYTASSGAEALEILEANPIDILISDQKMPGIKGTELLKRTKADYPNTLRILLTGYADVQSSIEAINKGEVYRYLTKPWNDEELKMTIKKVTEFLDLKRKNAEMEAKIRKQNKDLAILTKKLDEKVKERTAELEKSLEMQTKIGLVLKQNVTDSISLLLNILSHKNEQLAAHSLRVGEMTEQLTQYIRLNPKDSGLIYDAALLHDIGLLDFNSYLFNKPMAEYPDEDLKAYYQHPVIGENIIITLRNFKTIAKIVRHHHENANGSGFPDGIYGNQIPLGSRIIRIINEYDNLIYRSDMSFTNSLNTLLNQNIYYEQDILFKFAELVKHFYLPFDNKNKMKVKIADLQTGMLLAESIFLGDKGLLIPHGMLITEKVLSKISSLNQLINQEQRLSIIW